ncbi:MAG: exonuclease SbcCD subunit D [Bryobacteraceae bacterium]
MRFRFLHAADLHLDTPYQGVGGVAPDVAAVVRDASLGAFDRLVDLAIERKVAFVLLAGDVYEGPSLGVRAQLRFLRGVERLGASGISVFLVHGNHDPQGGWSMLREPPPNLAVFSSAQVESKTIERDSQRLATIHGISYGRPQVTENLALRFSPPEGPGLHIGLLHCAVGASEQGNPYSPCSVVDLERAGMDYWAIGHAHDHRILSESPWIVYPGTLQGRGARPGEWWAKGCVVVEVADERIEQVEFIPTDRVRFVEARVEVSSYRELVGLSAGMLAGVRQVADSHPGPDLLIRVTLEGRGPVHEQLAAAGRLEELRDDLREQLEGMSPRLWVDQIVDESRGLIDRDAVAQRGDFSSDLVRRSEQLREDPEALRQWIAAVAAPLSASRARRALPGPENWDPVTLLREADQRALDLLEGGQER